MSSIHIARTDFAAASRRDALFRSMQEKNPGDRISILQSSRGASRIRVVPAEDSSSVDYEAEGEFEQRMLIPRKAHDNVINRLKIMADLRPEKHLSQSGGISFGQFGRKSTDLELKIEVSPTKHGEKALLFLPTS